MLDEKVRFWYAERMAAKYKGEVKVFFVKALEDPSFVKVIEASLSENICEASSQLGIFIPMGKDTAKEIFNFLKFYFWSDETPVYELKH